MIGTAGFELSKPVKKAARFAVYMLTMTRQIIHQIVIIILPDQFLGMPSAGATARNEQIDSHRALGALMIAEKFIANLS